MYLVKGQEKVTIGPISLLPLNILLVVLQNEDPGPGAPYLVSRITYIYRMYIDKGQRSLRLT